MGNTGNKTGVPSFNDLQNIGLSPEQAALANFTLGQQNTRTEDIYSRLGLGGSTMERQDLGGNQLANLAQQSSLIGQNQQLALQDAQLQLGAQSNLGSTLGSLFGGTAGRGTGGGTGGTGSSGSFSTTA